MIQERRFMLFPPGAHCDHRRKNLRNRLLITTCRSLRKAPKLFCAHRRSFSAGFWKISLFFYPALQPAMVGRTN
jgi:hypothetical protein